MAVTQDGCLGGFGDPSLSYYQAYYTIGSGLINNAILKLTMREKNDPYYNIPFIIGFGGDNTWGVTAQDNLIILIIFWILGAICCFIQCGTSLYCIYRCYCCTKFQDDRYGREENHREEFRDETNKRENENQLDQTPNTSNNIEEKHDIIKTQEQQEMKEIPIETPIVLPFEQNGRINEVQIENDLVVEQNNNDSYYGKRFSGSGPAE